MPVCAPKDASSAAGALAVRLGRCDAAIVELACYSGAGAALAAAAAQASVPLPPFGRVARTPDALNLCVRPGRWLLLSAAAAAPPETAAWYHRATERPAVVDLSCALCAFLLGGAATLEVLRRGCRLDLDPGVLTPGSAAATIMAQVAVTLAVLPAGVLLLTPSSTARHFQEWLAAAARSFDFTLLPGVPFKDVCGERSL